MRAMLVLVAAASTAAHIPAAAAPRDGTILDEKPYVLPAYAELVERQRTLRRNFNEAVFRRRNPEAEWTARRALAVACSRFTYASEGSPIVGYMCRPKAGTAGARYPAFIYSKTESEETIDDTRIAALMNRASKGQIVLTTELRGNAGAAGRDEFGGRDVQDLIALGVVARNQPDWDGRNLVAYGASRGGLMILSAIRDGMELTAAAVHSVPADLSRWAEEHPSVTKLFKAKIPDFEGRRAEALKQRSPINWPDRIKVPVLLIAGRLPPPKVPLPSAAHTLALATELQKAGAPYEAIVLNGDLMMPEVDAVKDELIREWFARNKR